MTSALSAWRHQYVYVVGYYAVRKYVAFAAGRGPQCIAIRIRRRLSSPVLSGRNVAALDELLVLLLEQGLELGERLERRAAGRPGQHRARRGWRERWAAARVSTTRREGRAAGARGGAAAHMEGAVSASATLGRAARRRGLAVGVTVTRDGVGGAVPRRESRPPSACPPAARCGVGSDWPTEANHSRCLRACSARAPSTRSRSRCWCSCSSESSCSSWSAEEDGASEARREPGADACAEAWPLGGARGGDGPTPTAERGADAARDAPADVPALPLPAAAAPQRPFSLPPAAADVPLHRAPDPPPPSVCVPIVEIVWVACSDVRFLREPRALAGSCGLRGGSSWSKLSRPVRAPGGGRGEAERARAQRHRRERRRSKSCARGAHAARGEARHGRRRAADRAAWRRGRWAPP